jgi:hypothetical protein
MNTLLDFPSETILNIGQYLNKQDLENLYATCRRFREVVVVLLRRQLNARISRIRSIAKFTAENHQFSQSISTLYLQDDIEEDDKANEIIKILTSEP